MKKQLLSLSLGSFMAVFAFGQTASIDSTFNQGNLYQTVPAGSGEKIFSLGNESCVYINNDGQFIPPNSGFEHGITSFLTNIPNQNTSQATFWSVNNGNQYSSVRDLKKNINGDFLTASTTRINDMDYTPSLLIGRHHSNGSFDINFNNGFIFEYELTNGGDVTKIDQYSDGKILVGGRTGNALFLLKLKANGELDSTFGSNGFFTFSVMDGTNPNLTDFVITSSNDVYIVGYNNDSNFNNVPVGFIIKLKSDNTIDASFGVGGKVEFQMGDSDRETYVSKMVMNTNGDMYIAGEGYFDLGGGLIVSRSGIIKIKSDGTTDNTFGTNGLKIFLNWYSSSIQAIKYDPSGKLVIGLTATLNNTSKPYLAYLNNDGSFNTSVDTDGIIDLNYLATFSYNSFRDFDFQPDGKIVYTSAGAQNMQRATFVGRIKFSGNQTASLESMENANLKIYPNPTNSIIHISTTKPVDVELHNLQGELIAVYRNDHQLTIDLTQLPSGIYLIKAKDTVHKVVKL